MEKIIRTDHVKNEEVGNFKESKKREHPTYNRTMEGKVYWSHLPKELPSKIRY
jgi:hypothetical protein